MNLMMLLEMTASGFGDRIAFQNGRDTLSYSELYHAAGAAAAEISRSGCERMALLDVSSLAVPVALFGSAWAGVPFVPLNYRLTGAELETLIGQITPSYLVTEAERVEGLSRLPDTQVLGREAFLAQASSGQVRETPWAEDPTAIAILLYTSGTTGAPKAAVLRHQHLLTYIMSSVEFGSADENDAALVSVPPYHVAGMAAIASSVYSARRIVQLPSFSADAWIELAQTQSITHAFVVPTMLTRICERLVERGGADLPRLRSLSYGGGKMPLAVIERAMDLLPDTDFTQAYGLTETSSTITLLSPEDHRIAVKSRDPKIRRRLTSVGRALPGVELEIHDEDGRALGPDRQGEIHVRGGQISGEYLGRKLSLRSGGWFPTRDGGSMDADGYVFIDGRIDDIIVRGGENMSPGEIEDVLLDHEAVADSAVVGVPDEQWGEAVAAVVVLQPGCTVSEQELKDWVRERLRSSRTPERIEFRSELPYNETGKLLRRKVRDDLMGKGP